MGSSDGMECTYTRMKMVRHDKFLVVSSSGIFCTVMYNSGGPGSPR